MGVLSSLRDTLFGDAGKAGQKSQKRENEKNRQFIRESTQRAESQIEQIFPQIQQARLGGFQGAQDIFASAVPQQFGAFQQGNIQAQQTAAGVLPEQQAALLGSRPVSFGFAQPQQIQTPDFGFLNQPLQPQQQQAAQQPPLSPELQQFIAGLNIPNLGIGGEGGMNLSQSGVPSPAFGFKPFTGGGF